MYSLGMLNINMLQNDEDATEPLKTKMKCTMNVT